MISGVDRKELEKCAAAGVPTVNFCSSHAQCKSLAELDAMNASSLGKDASHCLPCTRPFTAYPNAHLPLHVDYVFHNLDTSKQTACIIPEMCKAAGYTNPAQFFHDLSCRVVRRLYSRFFALTDRGVKPEAVPADVSRPPIRKTMVLFADPSEGVGWTYGPEHDRATTSHIHFATPFMAYLLRDAFSNSYALMSSDYPGVIVHEFTHAWQNDAKGTMPGSMIEGVADWMRTNEGYAPDHWELPSSKHVRKTKWTDESNTQFLCWIERKFPGFVEEVNRICGLETFHLDNRGQKRDIAKQVCGRTWEELWKEWGDWLAKVETEGPAREKSWKRIFMDL